MAEAYIKQLNAAGVFTRLEPLQEFFEAEWYHQSYAALNPGQPYIAAVAMPKVEKLRDCLGETSGNDAFQFSLTRPRRRLVAP